LGDIKRKTTKETMSLQMKDHMFPFLKLEREVRQKYLRLYVKTN